MQQWMSIINRVLSVYFWGFSLFLGLVQSASAAPSGFPQHDTSADTIISAGKWIKVIEKYIKEGGVVIGLALSVLAFVWVGYAALAKFNEAREGRAEWAEMGVLAAAGAVILIFIAILLSQVGKAVGS